MTIAQAHKTICELAAQIANGDQRLPIDGTPFREAAGKSDRGGLCIDYDQGHIDMIPDLKQREELITTMTAIGRDALRQAVRQRADLVMAAMVAEGRRGSDYFNRFSTNNDLNVLPT